MPQTPHLEKHFTAGELVRDIVIGMSDGLTVPFALAAGLTGAIASSHIVLTAGFAEIAAGSIGWDSAVISPPAATPSITPANANARRRKLSPCRKSRREEVQDIFRLTG